LCLSVRLRALIFFFFNPPATPEFYTLSLHDALPIYLHPDWVAGISIGAINSAIIAGNPPKQRVDALREFWHTVSTSPLGIPYFRQIEFSDDQHQLVNQARALDILLFGTPNFFVPRLPSPIIWPPGWRGGSAQRQFRLFRQHHGQDHFRTYRRLGLAAAGFPGNQDRRGVFLGRWLDLEYAARMGARFAPAARHARLPGRPLECARR